METMRAVAMCVLLGTLSAGCTAPVDKVAPAPRVDLGPQESVRPVGLTTGELTTGELTMDGFAQPESVRLPVRVQWSLDAQATKQLVLPDPAHRPGRAARQPVIYGSLVERR